MQTQANGLQKIMKIPTSQKGFTLIEVLVAMTIFAIGLLAIAGMQITALKGNSSANTQSAATAMASGILEEILIWDLADPRLAADSADNDWDFDPATAGVQTQSDPDDTLGAGTYSAKYSVDINHNGVNNVTRITVTVTGGRTFSGAVRTVTLVGFKRAV